MARTTDDPYGKKPCDLVLRGGITSGVIYPGTIHGLAEDYRFVNVGGASAGAIAAGVTAAAEYGRQTGSRPEAFEELRKLATKVSGGPGSETSMRRLFSPDRRFWLASALLWWWLETTPTVRTWVRRVLLALVVAAAAAPLLALLQVAPALVAYASVLFYVVLAFAFFALWRLRYLVTTLPKAGFGLCPGANPDVAPTLEAHRRDGWLADWLHATIQDMAGRNGVGTVPEPTPETTAAAVPLAAKPLTVGDLWGVQARADQPAWRTDRTRRLQLTLTTTNLSHQLPQEFPELGLPGTELYFCRDELRRVLPEDVVRWMVLAGRAHAEARGVSVPAGYHLLPESADLPVVLGVRLSLSFPGLLAAVPLHALAIAPVDGPAPQPERCWFSDGGITSNFPISAFDGALPTRPTFCVNLRSADTAEEERVENLEEAVRNDILVWMPPVGDRPQAPRILTRLGDSLASFVASVGATSRNAHENELMLMPGYRDRIIEVSTRKKEGGLNLAMPPETIEELSRRGAWAAVELRRRFAPPEAGGEDGWPAQRWVRLRSTMDALEHLLASFERGWSTPTSDAPPFDEMRRSACPPAVAPCYPWADAEMAAAADRCLDALRAAALVFEAEERRLQAPVFDRPEEGPGAAPRPPLALAMRPSSRGPLNPPPPAATA